MRNFQDTFETGKRSLISAFSICMTVPLTEIIFAGRFPHPDRYSYEIPHEYWPEPTEKKSLCYVCVILSL